MCLEDCGNKRSRRAFLASAGAAFAGLTAAAALSAQSVSSDKIAQELIGFKNGADLIKGYLAYPKKKTSAPAVLVLHGNWGVSEDVRHTAARLAEAGFIGLAISPTSRENDDISRISRDFAMSDRFMMRYVADAQAAVEFLKEKSLYNDRGFGVLGYCGGGITATRLAATDSRVRAVVAFYASPTSAPERVSKTDPRPNMLEYIGEIKIPMQFHYGTRDGLIPNETVAKLREKLEAAGHRKPEIYIYDGAQHGFANTTDDTYHAEYARLAEKRWKKFLQKHL